MVCMALSWLHQASVSLPVLPVLVHPTLYVVSLACAQPPPIAFWNSLYQSSARVPSMPVVTLSTYSQCCVWNALINAIPSLADRIGAKRTYFTHLSHLLGPHEKAEASLPEGIRLAHDGLTLVREEGMWTEVPSPWTNLVP